MNKICIENLTQRFVMPRKKELTALHNINLTIKKNEFIAIIGESGCGKSTLLNIIGGLLKPVSGTVSVNGLPVTGPHHSRMMMFQQPCLLPWLTVEENIAFGCKLRKETEGLSDKVADFIKTIGLEGFGNVYPNALSAGMLQRVALARSLIGHPEILLMDEAFSDVDFFTRIRLLELLSHLWKKLDLTILLVTHDIDEALLLAERIILVGGRPGGIQGIFPITEPFPRDMGNPVLYAQKKEILNRFKPVTATASSQDREEKK